MSSGGALFRPNFSTRTVLQPADQQAFEPLAWDPIRNEFVAFPFSQLPGGTTGIINLQNSGFSAPIGSPVYPTGPNTFSLAFAASVATANVIGLVTTTIPSGVQGGVMYSGILTLTTLQWDAIVTGQIGGLSAGSIYYLDPGTPGKLTTTQPTGPGQPVVLIGTALSHAMMLVEPQIVIPGPAGTPGGSSGQVQYNNAGAFAGLSIGGDASLNTGTGALTVTKTGGVAFATSATTDATNASNISAGILPAARLPATAVTPSTYGDSTHVGQFTVGPDGRLTAATNVAISGGGGGGTPGGSSGQVQYNNAGAFGGFTVGGDGTLNTGTGALSVAKTGGVAFAASAITDATNASNISAGILPAARLPATAVTSSTYGDSTHVGQFTVGTDGRLTFAANVAISGGGGGGGTSDGTLNVLALPAPFAALSLINDGVIPVSGGIGSGTDNAANWTSFLTTGIKTFGKGATFVGVTVSGGVFTYANHGLQPGAGLLAQTTAGGVVSGTTYYVMSPQGGTYTKDTFQLSTTNNEFYGGESLLVVSGSATYNFQMTGVEKISITVPPGYYYFSNSVMDNRFGVKNLEIDFNGGFVYNVNVGDNSFFFPYGGTGHPELWGYLTLDYVNLTSSVINISTADAAKFTVGAKVMLCGVDTQINFGGFPGLPSTPGTSPINNFVFDYRRITAINLGTGAITLDRPPSRCYLTTWPIFYSGIYPDWGSGSAQFSGGGAAVLVYIHPGWDAKRVFKNIHTLAGSGQVASSISDLTLIDCQFDDRGVYPSMSERVVHERCTWGTDIELDKMVVYASYTDCQMNIINTQSGSIERAIFNRCTIKQLNGTPKNAIIDSCDIGMLGVGPTGQGITESLTVRNSNIGNFQDTAPFWAPSSSVYGAKFGNGYVGSYTFSANLLKQPLETTTANFWAIPGCWMYFADYGNRFANMGPSFRVVDIYSEDAAGTIIKPGVGTSVALSGPGTGSTPVNIVVTAASISGGAPVNGDTVFFTGPATWPYPAAQQLIPYFPFKVCNFGVPGANKFNIALLGTPTTPVQGFSWPVSPPNLTAVKNPLFVVATTLKFLPTGGSTTTNTISFTNAAGNLQVNWAGHTLVVDDSVLFSSTGGLPSTVTSLQPYFVISTNPGVSFQIAQQYLVGGLGGPVAFGSGASGTITAISNAVQLFRHPCPRFTAANNGGGTPTPLNNILATMDGAVDEPLYSRCKVALGGIQEGTASFKPTLYAWGNVKQITINVVQPCTIANNLTLTARVTDATSASLPVTTNTQIIDTTVPGIRTITRTAATSPGGAGDTIAAITKWLTGSISYALSANTGDPSTMPLVIIEILTDQGINDADVLAYVPFNYHTQISAGTAVLAKP